MNDKAIVNNNVDEKIVHKENDREVKLAPFMTLQIGVSMYNSNKYYIRIPLCMLWGNPVIFTDCGENPMINIGFLRNL